MRMADFALKSLVGRRRKYLFLCAAISFGFFIMTVTTGLTEGMLQSVRRKGAFYFTGNVNIVAYTATSQYLPLDVPLVERAALAVTGHAGRVSLRSIYYNTDPQIYFAGQSVRQRRVVGLDWGTERAQFGSMNFTAGRVPDQGDERAALISESAAKKLGVRVGDELTISLMAEKGRNTAPLVVRGIFRETSIFGYAIYVDRTYLNRILGRHPDCATELGIYLNSGANELGTAGKVAALLSRDVSTTPVVRTRGEQDALFGEKFDGVRYMVMTLDAHLSSITQILDAITLVSYFLLAIFLLITVIGISNTYRVVVYERSAEIGVMRAMGMKKRWAVGIFVEEAGLLTLISVAIGFLCGIGVLDLLTFADFSGYSAMGLFLEQGHFLWAFNPYSLTVVFSVICLTTLVAAWAPARKAARVKPAEIMRTEGE